MDKERERHKKKMEMVTHLSMMWEMFAKNIFSNKERDDDIEKFLDAKDRVHQLLAEL